MEGAELCHLALLQYERRRRKSGRDVRVLLPQNNRSAVSYVMKAPV